MVKIIPERRKTMYGLLRMLILLKAIPVSNNSFYTFKLWSVPTLVSCMIWFLPPTLFFVIAEWRAEIELSTVQEIKSENANSNRYVPVPVWQIQNIFMEMQIRIWIHFSIWCISRCCSRSGSEKKNWAGERTFFFFKICNNFSKISQILSWVCFSEEMTKSTDISYD